MSDKDREAFETYCETALGSPVERNHGVYRNGSVQAAWIGWQAARDSYVKLTEAEFLYILNDASIKKWRGSDMSTKDGWDKYVSEITAALKAAGLRFKEEV